MCNPSSRPSCLPSRSRRAGETPPKKERKRKRNAKAKPRGRRWAASRVLSITRMLGRKLEKERRREERRRGWIGGKTTQARLLATQGYIHPDGHDQRRRTNGPQRKWRLKEEEEVEESCARDTDLFRRPRREEVSLRQTPTVPRQPAPVCGAARFDDLLQNGARLTGVPVAPSRSSSTVRVLLACCCLPPPNPLVLSSCPNALASKCIFIYSS
jgi:hypothetical protein